MIAFLSICFILSIPLASAGTVENEPTYSYTSDAKNGPDHWGELTEEWKKCSTGHAQSPIDIQKQSVVEQLDLGKLMKSYWPSRAILKRHHHYVELKWKNYAGGISINGTWYDLIQLHWHTPSEHTINGRRYDMEMHILHRSSDNRIAVIGIFYKYGHPDKFLTMLEPYIRSMSATKDKVVPVGNVNPKYAKGFSKKYYRYRGSSTSPPCTEGVVWTILTKVRSVSREQVQMLKAAANDKMESNARPVQNINGRVVSFYRSRKLASRDT